MSYVFGEFNFNGVHIDINKNVDDFDVGTTTLHELCHQELSSNSYIGTLDFLLMNVIKDCSDDKILSKLIQLYSRVSNSSIRVQESTAMFQEFAFLKVLNSKKYYELLNYYKYEIDYYKKYKFNDVEFLLSYIEDAKEAVDVSSNVKTIALLAMNIDIFTLNPLDGKYLCQIDRQQDLYNANYRFSKVIKHIKTNQLDIRGYSEIKIQKIFTDIGFNCTSFSWNRFEEWAINALLEPLHLFSTEKYIHCVEDISPNMQLLSASGYNSDSEKYKRHECHNKSEIEDAIRKSQVLCIENSKNCSFVTNRLVNSQDKEYFEYNTDKVFLATFDYLPIVCTDRNHYLNLVMMEPKIENKYIFVDLANMDFDALKFIKDMGVKEYFICSLNKEFVVIFMKGIKAPIIFHVTSLLNVSIWIDTYLEEYSYRKTWWDEIIPMKNLQIFMNFILHK